LTTDFHPKQTTWTLSSNATGTILIEGGPYNQGETTFIAETCVAMDDCSIFSIYDEVDLGYGYGTRFSNGMSFRGLYALYVGEELYYNNSLADSADRVFVGNCSECPERYSRMSILVRSYILFSWRLLDASNATIASDDNSDDHPEINPDGSLKKVVLERRLYSRQFMPDF
jgi:hypothetical protein